MLSIWFFTIYYQINKKHWLEELSQPFTGGDAGAALNNQ